MYLKRLEIRGFKSFAEKTVLDFLPPKSGRNSVTAVVGPNGAGKSNISDAVRWVMGEQSLKNLRGKKSEDVIFGGSEDKGQLGSAEVTMILNNKDGKILPDYPEVVISRRLYRSGEGEYLVNNSPVRLLDVRLLLAKAQFAQHSYGIIGQGMIDRLLTVGPTERKDYLDEASGIKEFKIKQHQAKLKLARSRENITQADRLMQEVSPRLKMLARQVKKLEKRQEVETQLRENQESYYSSIYTTNQKELEQLTKQLEKVESDYREQFQQLTAIQEELAGLAKASSRQEVFDKLQADYQTAINKKNETERQLAIKEGKLQTQYSQSGQHSVSWLSNKASELENKSQGLAKKVGELQSQADSIKTDLLEKKSRVEQLTTDKTTCQGAISELEQKIFESQSEQNYHQLTGLLAVQAVLENKSEFGQVYGLVAQLASVPEDYSLALEVAAGSYLSAVVTADEKAAQLAIEFLRKNHLGVASFLPRNKIKPRQLSAEEESILSKPGVVGLASELAEYDDKFDNIFEFVFKQTIVVETLSVAQRIGVGRARMVTLAGDLLEKTGVIRGGYRKLKKGRLTFSSHLALGAASADRYQEEIKSKKAELVEIESKLEEARASLMENETKKETTFTKLEVLTAEHNQTLQELASLQQELSLLKATPAQQGKIMTQLAEEKTGLQKQIEQHDKDLKKLSEKIEAFNKDEEAKKQRVFALQAEMQTKQTQVNEFLSQRNDFKVQLARLETKQDSIEEEVRLETATSIASILDRQPPQISSDELEATQNKIQKLKYQLSLIGGIDEEVREEHDQTKEKHDFLTNQISDLEKAIVDLEKMIVELEEVMKKKSSVAFKQIRKEFIRYVKILFEGGNADMKEIYGEPEEDLEEEMAEEEDPDQAKKTRKKKVVTGIDITINPPGKKIKHLNTLSGGERTLASIALVCAVLSYNPAPFVVLDEVEAALDEANSRRFAKIVTELSKYSQFIIITHNRVTMHSADVLYGVTMGATGVSKLLSVKLSEAEKQANLG